MTRTTRQNIIHGAIKGIWWTAAAIFAGELTLFAIHWSGGLR